MYNILAQDPITLLSIFTLIVSTAVTVAVYMGLAYLGGKLFGSDIPEADTGETPNAQSRSWNPRSTQQEGIARPRAWGKNLHHGNIVAKWTDVDGDEREVLYIIVEHGDGPTEGIVTPIADNVFLNDQPAGNFGSVDIQERVGTNNQTVMTGFEKTKLEYPIGNELILNEAITFTTPNDFFDDIEYTIMWPNGLRKYHKSGGMDYSASTVKVRIREHPSGGWTEIFNEAVTVRQIAPLFKLYKVNTLSPGYVERGKQYDLEFTNLSGPYERHINDVYIRSVREVIEVGFERPGKALVGIRAIATSKLSGQLDIKVIREDRLINVFDGSTWSIEYSRNRSWIVFDAFTQPVIDGDGNSEPWVIHHYEGLDPSRLDLTFFLNWASFCSDQVPDGYGGTEDRLACDTILDFQTSVWKFTNEVANVGRASLYWQGHLLTGWIDKVVSETTALVTMDNIMARSWANQWVEPGELAGRAEVFFNDSRQGYERTPASLPNESAGRYTKIISIEGIGVTTRGTAIHVANHVLKRNELIRNINNFRQYKDAFRYKLGDVLRIQHRTPDWGTSYRVTGSTANNKVTLDRTCDAVADELLYVQSYDESLEKVRIDSYTVLSVSDKVVTIVETWDVTPLKNYMVAIGVTGEIKLRRIIKIDSTADNYFDITVETYDTELFDADDLDPDNPNQNYTWGTPANPLTRPVTRDEVIDLINTLAMPQPDIDMPVTSNLTWSGNSVDTVTWSKTDATEAIIFRYKGTDYEITADSTTDEFIYWDPAYNTIFRTTNSRAVAVAAAVAGSWIMCTNKDGVPSPATPIQIIHGGLVQAGTIIASTLFVVGILGSGQLDLGQIGAGDLDDIDDGTTYKKLLAALQLSPSDNFVDNPDFEADYNGWSQFAGGGTISIESISDGHFGSKVARCAGGDEYGGVLDKYIPIDPSKTYYGEFWVRQTINPTSGGSLAFAGVWNYDYQKDNAVADGGQFRKWFITSSQEILVVDGWQLFTGYITGIGAGSSQFDTDCRYIRPCFFVNYQNGDGTAEVAYFRFTEVNPDNIPESSTRKWAAESGADVTGGRLALIASSMLPNWRLDVADLAGRPAGIYPIRSISDFSGLDWLDGNKAEIKIAHASDSSVGYGFPAIPIDDKQKYKIVIRHKAPVASGNGLYLSLYQYNASLPAGKTHIGFEGGTNTQDRTNYIDILSNGAFPGTSWEVDEYTYIPTAGTKYASFGMYNVVATTKEYHVDYVLMYVVPKTAAEIAETASLKWAAETGADVTGAHEADIALANLGEKSVDSLVEGATYGKMLKAWKHGSDVTLIDGGKIYAKSIDVAVGAIGDLAVDTLQIANEAVTLMVAVYTAAQLSYVDTNWHEVQTVDIETSGQPVLLMASVQWDADHFSGLDIRIQRDGADVYLTHLSSIGDYGNPFSVGIVDEPGSGTYTYDVDMRCTPGAGAEELAFRHRSLIAKEVKK